MSDSEGAPKAEAELRSPVPICAQCDERPAACFGLYEGGDPEVGPSTACDRCCGHGCEDGWCVPIGDLPGWAATVSLNADRITLERDLLRDAVVDLLASAHPHPGEHPAMSLAWARAQDLIRKIASSGEGSLKCGADRGRSG